MGTWWASLAGQAWVGEGLLLSDSSPVLGLHCHIHAIHPRAAHSSESKRARPDVLASSGSRARMARPEPPQDCHRTPRSRDKMPFSWRHCTDGWLLASLPWLRLSDSVVTSPKCTVIHSLLEKLTNRAELSSPSSPPIAHGSRYVLTTLPGAGGPGFEDQTFLRNRWWGGQ